MQNRHPADRLADVRSEIKRLEEEEAKLRAYLLEHPQDRMARARKRLKRFHYALSCTRPSLCIPKGIC
jgi:hypothetical protein